MSAPAVLLDTNAAIAWTRLDLPFFAALPKGGLPCLSLFTLGELAFGAEFAARRDENLHSLSALERDSRLILPNRETAMHFGSLHAALRRKGRPIPVNDIWIAATALQHRLPTMTRDAHFREVEGLELRMW